LVFLWTFGGTIVLMRRVRKESDWDDPSRLRLYALGIEIGLYGWLVGGLFVDLSNVDPAFWFVAFAVSITRLAGISEPDEAESGVLPHALSVQPV